MSGVRHKRWSAVALICSFPCALPAQSLDNLKRQALEHPGAYDFLRELSDGIGPRLTGSSEEARAGQWALATMRKIGLQNVHGEPWQLERGWKRGYARAQLVSPFSLGLTIASQGWTGSTQGGETEADVVQVDSNHLAEEASKNSAKWAGKILLIAPRDPSHQDIYGTLSQLPTFLAAAKDSGAVAIIERDSRRGVMLAHTGPGSVSARALPMAYASLAREQADLITRLLNAGTPVRVRIDIRNDFTPGEVSSSNIVGEITGSRYPDEVVILGAHLDSWDQGTGTIDDGFGVAAVLGAAKSIIEWGLKPQRTIRFVLFTGEEQGLLGSRAYTRQHQAEMKNVECTLVLDWGYGPITKYLLGGHDEFTAALQELFPALAGVASPQVGKGFLTYTDGFSFTLAGVPEIGLFQDSPDYSLLGHSAADTLDKVDPQVLIRDSAALAISGLWFANYPMQVGSHWSQAKTAQMLDDQRRFLQALELWPF